MYAGSIPVIRSSFNEENGNFAETQNLQTLGWISIAATKVVMVDVAQWAEHQDVTLEDARS